MAIWKAKISSGVRVYFNVKRNGLLITGLGAGVFTVVLISPDDTANTTLVVNESIQLPGIYYVDIPSAFLTTNGAGHYGLSIGIHKSAPGAIDDEVLYPLEVSQYDLDSFATAIISADLLVSSGSTITEIRTSAMQATGFYNGLIAVIINSAGNVARTIINYNNTNGAFTLDIALPFTPNVDDRFIVLSRVASAAAAIDTNAIAIAVWARTILAPAVESYGELVNQIGDLTSLIPASL